MTLPGFYYQTMNIRSILVLAISHLYLCLSVNAQYDNVWAFGDGAGIDFNFTPPKAIQTGIGSTTLGTTLEASSVVCDSSGKLLFYTDGDQVWDRNHQVMPNGKDLPGSRKNITHSAAQGALIIQMPGYRDKYYVFSLGMKEDRFFYGRVYYSIVDMSMNNGWGDVDSNFKGVLLDSFLMEGMIGVAGNGCNIWLIVSAEDTIFKTYNIDLDGISNTPLCSYRIWNAQTSNRIGFLNISPDRSKLICADGDALILYDFDSGSGEISNPFILRNGNGYDYYYSAAFSEDNTKLYAVAGDPLRGLIQYDLLAGDSLAIINSRVTLDDGTYGQLRLGPDGKIYVTNPVIAATSSSLSVVNNPNLKGTSCVFEKHGFDLNIGGRSRTGLPNIAAIVTNKEIYIDNVVDTAYCSDSMLLQPNNLNGKNYTWEDGSTSPDRYIYESGIYWVTYLNSSPGRCEEYTDTFKIVLNKIKRTYTTTEFEGMCAADTFFMQANNLNETNYLWEDGSTATGRKINKTGTYWVSYQNDSLCERFADTFIVVYPEDEYRVSFMVDTLICHNDTVHFQNTSDPHFDDFKWSFGASDFSILKDPQYVYPEAGSYTVTLTGTIKGLCPDTAQQIIVIDPRLEARFITDKDSICQGESIMFTHNMNKETITDLHWQTGDRNDFSTFDNEIRHAYDRPGTMPLMLTAQFRACPTSSFSDTVYVSPLPLIDFGQDTKLCLTGSPVILKNRHAADVQHYLWNTGDTTETLHITHPGMYSLTVRGVPLGCSTTETIEVKKDCYIDIPNAFSPDGDGINDYFFPRQLLSGNVTAFKMQVFNRWGQIVFETIHTNGSGWDGQYQGKDQPEGSYVYHIVISINGREETYTGNVTLIR